MIKRNQNAIDQCLDELVREKNSSSISALLENSAAVDSIEIPRYARVNLLKTTTKKLRLALKELKFRKMKNV